MAYTRLIFAPETVFSRNRRIFKIATNGNIPLKLWFTDSEALTEGKTFIGNRLHILRLTQYIDFSHPKFVRYPQARNILKPNNFTRCVCLWLMPAWREVKAVYRVRRNKMEEEVEGLY